MVILIMMMVMMMSVLDKHVLGDVANLVNPPPTSSTGKHDDQDSADALHCTIINVKA